MAKVDVFVFTFRGVVSNPNNLIAVFLYSKQYILILNFGGKCLKKGPSARIQGRDLDLLLRILNMVNG